MLGSICLGGFGFCQESRNVDGTLPNEAIPMSLRNQSSFLRMSRTLRSTCIGMGQFILFHIFDMDGVQNRIVFALNVWRIALFIHNQAWMMRM